MESKAESFPLKISLRKNIGKAAHLFYNLRPDKRSLRVLTYHNITERQVPNEWLQMTTPRELFDRQMKYLKENDYNVVSAEDVCRILSSDTDVKPKTVCITFDDGYRDNYVNAFPVLKKHGLKATVFITADFIGKEKGRFGEYLTWRDIDSMREGGTFTFGCHSFSHKNLATLKADELSEEIRPAKHILENHLGGMVKTFAYPFGWHNSFNRTVSEAVRKEGFLCAFTGIHGANTKRTNAFQLRRVRVSWLDDCDNFRRILQGSDDWYWLYQKAISACGKKI